MTTIAFFAVLLALVPATTYVASWIVNKSFDAAERFGRFRGTICL